MSPTARPNPAHAPSSPSPRPALASLALAMLLSSLGTSIANVALPTLAASFGASFQQVQWVVVAYLLGITGSIVAVGRLADLVDRRRVLAGGLLLFTAAAGFSGAASSLPALVAGRLAQGVGAAALMALTLAFVSDIVPKARTGSAMGMLGTTSAIGTALGPSVGGGLIELLGWRAIFLVQVPLGLSALYLALRFLPTGQSGRADASNRFDVVGTLLLAGTLVAGSLALTLGRGDFGAVNAACLAIAMLGAATFIAVERRVASPVVPLALFADPSLRAGLLMSMLVATVLMATLVVGPFYLALGLGLSTGTVGLVIAAGPLVAALSGVPAGRLVDRLGSERTTTAGLLAIVLGTVALATIPPAAGVLGYITPIVVITAGYALFQAANNTGMLRELPAERRGVVSGMLTLSRNLGLVSGAAFMGAVFAAASGHDDITQAPAAAVATGLHGTFAVAAALVGLALGVGLRGRTRAAWLWALLLGMVLSGQAMANPPAATPPTVAATEQPASLRPVGLIQVQHVARWAGDGADDGTDINELFINRARLGVTGHAPADGLRTLLVADFGRGRASLLYASLDKELVPGSLSVRVGQFKRPFSRSFLTPSSQLALIDRPLPVGVFGDGADIGIMLHDGGPRDGAVPALQYSLGLFRGGALGSDEEGVHPVVVLRVDAQSATSSGLGEHDLAGGPPRVGIGSAVLVDLDAAAALPASAVLDAQLQAHGLTLESAVFVATRADDAEPPAGRFATVGHYTQASVVIARRAAPAARYALVLPVDGGPAQHEVSAGLDIFIGERPLVLQTGATLHFGPPDVRSARTLTVQSQVSLAL